MKRGAGKGLGYNVNIPLALGSTAWQEYEVALQQSLDALCQFNADVLIVSLGVDTYEGDPISHFRLKSSDFKRIGTLIAQLNMPCQFVFEGGYAVDDIGVNTVNVLESFCSAQSV